MSENSGIIRKKKSKFSMISNTLALDPTISAKAKGIYLIICAELNKVNYTVYKSTIQASCRDGEASFESGWKELKDAGYLIQTKSKGKRQSRIQSTASRELGGYQRSLNSRDHDSSYPWRGTTLL